MTAVYKHFLIFKAALLDIRTQWAWYLLLMMANPLAVLLFLQIIAKGVIDFDAYMTGSVVMTFGTGIFLSLGQTISHYKKTAALDYYLSLPLSKEEIVLSQVFRNIVLSLPSMIIISLIGTAIYHVKISLNLLFFLAVLLTSISLAGLGTMIGVLSPTMQVASIMTQVVTPILIYLAPVFVTVAELPKPIQLISYVFPTRYAANAIRAAISGQWSLDYLVLFLIGGLSMMYVVKFVDWRQD